MSIIEKHFEKMHPPLKNFLEKTATQQELQTIIIVVEKQVFRYLSDEKYYQGFVSQKNIVNDLFELTFLSASLLGFAT
jgi:hypothetical protein